ncbi:hypothetical protein SteCoe_34952 [Stentor coeruleus]|uniref:Uncharacterized protein n=1 Tax=Stentor coeruleus TaxID=5963 RepID=A0A1R2ATE1_9CILI|nr:hypothetical protein SteCoe_34952 [Stentor coeruleus]
MDSAIYIVSVKNCKDEWLDKRLVHSFTPLMQLLQDRLAFCMIISAPVCECLQFAGLMTSEANPDINIIESLSNFSDHFYEQGVVTSLQQTILKELKIDEFSDKTNFIPLFNYLLKIDSNSIIFVPDSFKPNFESFSELRKDSQQIDVFRVKYNQNMKVVISSLDISRERIKFIVRKIKPTKLGSCDLICKETGEVMAKFSNLQEELLVKIYNKGEILGKEDRKNVLKVLRQENKNIYGQRFVVMKNTEIISNEWAVPEYLVDAYFDNKDYFVRIRNKSDKKYNIVEVTSGDYRKLVDTSEIPINDTLLIKIRGKNVNKPARFCVKFQDAIISNVFEFVTDQVE